MCALNMDRNDIRADQAPAPVGAYPHARRAGPLLFLSGVGPRAPGSGEVPGNRYGDEGQLTGYDIAAQCRAVFRNVEAILRAAGARREDLVDVTVFLTDMQRDFATFNHAWARFFPDHQPCRTTVEVRALPTPIAVELKCIAWLDRAEDEP